MHIGKSEWMRALILILSLGVVSFVLMPDDPADGKWMDPFDSRSLYEQIGNKSMAFEAFDLAYRGWLALRDSLNLKKNIISVVDFSQPSDHKRFYLIDMNSREVIYQNYVAHGKNTGALVAKSFSNKPNSYQSSLGFYKTGETYYGKHGLSLRLDGLEEGINSKARERAIVIHAAKYAEESFIKKYGRLGRSFGCPALPEEDFSYVIDLIKDGTLLFIYHSEEGYLKVSTVLN
jgi:hypothetical protein